MLAAASICLIAVARDNTALILSSKWIPAALLGLLCGLHLRGRVRWLACCGFGFSSLGDLTLEGMYAAPNSTIAWFAIGLGCFLTAHIFYIALFWSMQPRHSFRPLLLMLGYSAVMFQLCAPNAGTMAIAIAAYMLVISLMVWRAACVSIFQPKANFVWRWAPLAAALTFAASDSLIAINRFVEPFDGARYAILVSYWMAQAGIASVTIHHFTKENHVSA